uniref:C-type lectin domain-containing protein n=1 Tax=Cyprinus carpio TaxID=7962 RepID=A0A8C1ZCU1_CYPCA
MKQLYFKYTLVYLFFTRDGLSVFIGGWKCHQSSLYFLSSETKSWSGSRKYCTDKKADLISINNQEEQDFVKNISGGKLVWIGLTDTDVEGTWKWVDRSNMTFRFWETGQQNNKEEDCALSHSPGWADFPCGDRYNWICEKTPNVSL